MSQGQLVIPAAVDRSTVAHIEKGRFRGSERFWKIVDKRCRADGAPLAGFHAWQAAWQDHEVRTREAQLAEARARGDALRATTAPQLVSEVDQRAGHEVVACRVAAAVVALTVENYSSYWGGPRRPWPPRRW